MPLIILFLIVVYIPLGVIFRLAGVGGKGCSCRRRRW